MYRSRNKHLISSIHFLKKSVIFVVLRSVELLLSTVMLLQQLKIILIFINNFFLWFDLRNYICVCSLNTGVLFSSWQSGPNKYPDLDQCPLLAVASLHPIKWKSHSFSSSFNHPWIIVMEHSLLCKMPKLSIQDFLYLLWKHNRLYR